MAEERMLNDEILLGLIKKNSGGGTSDYSQLTNKPEINGVTLSGDKSASDLGLQNELTAGNYVSISNDGTINVTQGIGVYDVYSYKFESRNGAGWYKTTVIKSKNGVQQSSTVYSNMDVATPVNIDDRFTLGYGLGTDSKWRVTLLVDSNEHLAGEEVVWSYSETKDFTETFNVSQDESTDLATKGDVSTAIATKADLTDLAPAFSTATAYAVGQYVSYDGNIYKCTSAHSAGAWVAGDFTLVAVASELETKQNKTDNSLTTTSKDTTGAINELNSNLTSCNNYKRRSRRDITSDLSNLATAISEQDLEKYGYSIGDYFVSTGFTGSTGYTYVLADMDTFYGGYNNNAVVSTHHISLVVKTGANSKWAETNDTSGGYKNSTLHTYLSTTVLDNIKADMIHFFGGTTGLEHLISHKLLWTTATSGAWAWSDNAEYISALSEPQVYGTNVWAIDGYQTGEAWKWLEVFHKFSFNQILGNIWWWLRSICSALHACSASTGGYANDSNASDSGGAVGIILFH